MNPLAMKPSRHFSQVLQWIVIAVIIVAVIATGILTNITLRSIEKNLPNTLLSELEALDLLVDDIGEVVSAAETTQMTPSAENHILLGDKVQTVFNDVVKLRNTYVYDNMAQASALHAVVAPAITDIQLWLSEGVPGYGPQTATTMDVIISRATSAFSKARALKRDSQKIAQSILNAQRIRLEHFLLSVNLLFLMTLAVTVTMIFLVYRRQVFFRRELEVQKELRRTGNTLQETEELYSKLVAALPDVVVRTDVNGRVLFLNDVGLQISGYQRTDIVGKNLLEFIAPEDREYAAENLIRMFENKLGPKKYSLIMKEGEKIPFEINSDVLRRNDGSPYGTVNICRDISKRLHAEEALRESEKRYRLLVENANDAIFIAQDGKIKFPNPRVMEILGFDKEQTEEIPFIDFIHPDDREMVIDMHRRRMDGKLLGATNYLFRVINAAGREFTLQMNGVRIDWEGRPASLNIARDITDQLNLENSLRQAQKMEAIGTLAGGIAHDFNNLLMGIQGRVSLMMLGMEASHPFFENLRRIEDTVINASDLTQQLLGFARGGKYEVTPACMNDILDQSIELFGRTRKEIQIHKNYEDALWTVEVDRGQMHQVLLNLFVNACQAMPGGGNLHLRTENCVMHENTVGIPEFIPGNYVKTSVTDTGIGMDETTMARIFEPFFTTKEMGRGTGLGLASSYGIIRNHNGWICADSSIGQGSTFSFYLPASEKSMNPKSQAPVKELKGTESILLVDDEDNIIDICRQYLEVLGYTAFTANSGQEAIEIYRREFGKIDLVILDMIMPAMNGCETIHHLKAINPDVRIILSSGYNMDGQNTETINYGCSGFIQKPYGITELSQMIRQALE